MSITLRAQTIFVTDEPSENFPAGTLFCEDADGNVYQYRNQPALHPYDDEGNLDPERWPDPIDGFIPLYRDYWCYVGAPVAPNAARYFAEIFSVLETAIVVKEAN